MPTITFSSGVTNAFTAQVLDAIYSPGSSTSFYIYPGTQATNLSQWNAASGTHLLQRSSWHLVNTPSVINQRQAQIFTSTGFSQAANASGTAGWFAFWKFQSSPSETHIVTGTISLPGGGGDMEMSNLNIVSGVVYKMIDLIITIPDSVTY